MNIFTDLWIEVRSRKFGVNNLFLWSYDRLHLYTVNSSFGLKCIKFKGCLLWNSLPRSITDINSHVVFKKKLKCYLS